jgi:hypothetical protein
MILLVGAEGFEVSFPSDRYAVFFVRFSCKTTQFEGLAIILRRTLLSGIFSPMDSFSQDFRITSYHQIAQSRDGGSLHSVPQRWFLKALFIFALVREARTAIEPERADVMDLYKQPARG